MLKQQPNQIISKIYEYVDAESSIQKYIKVYKIYRHIETSIDKYTHLCGALCSLYSLVPFSLTSRDNFFSCYYFYYFWIT